MLWNWHGGDIYYLPEVQRMLVNWNKWEILVKVLLWRPRPCWLMSRPLFTLLNSFETLATMDHLFWKSLFFNHLRFEVLGQSPKCFLRPHRQQKFLPLNKCLFIVYDVCHQFLQYSILKQQSVLALKIILEWKHPFHNIPYHIAILSLVLCSAFFMNYCNETSNPLRSLTSPTKQSRLTLGTFLWH